MTSLHGRSGTLQIKPLAKGSERRRHRRHDLEPQGIAVERCDGSRQGAEPLGKLVDISAGGVRIRTSETAVQADNQIRVRLKLPTYAGICPFVDTNSSEPQPKAEWVGWMSVARVRQIGKEYEIAGSLVDMEELDRGMLGLYLSTQPLAA